MTIWRHLYDPNTDTHYTNGGYIPDDVSTPVEGWQWRQGYAPEGSQPYEVISYADQLMGLLKATGQQVGQQEPTEELIALARMVIAITNELTSLADTFGGGTELYRQAALGRINELPTLPDNLEPVKQAMLAILQEG
jgi:hypothetical protein